MYCIVLYCIAALNMNEQIKCIYDTKKSNKIAAPFANQFLSVYFTHLITGECEVVSFDAQFFVLFPKLLFLSTTLPSPLINNYHHTVRVQNPKYMLLECAPACQTCHQLSFEHRCPYDRDAPKVWGPGDLNTMFERLTTDEYYIKQFEPTIHSQPPDGPWLITLENVATEEECKRMIRLGADRGYERSQDVGAK